MAGVALDTEDTEWWRSFRYTTELEYARLAPWVGILLIGDNTSSSEMLEVKAVARPDAVVFTLSAVFGLCEDFENMPKTLDGVALVSSGGWISTAQSDNIHVDSL